MVVLDDGPIGGGQTERTTAHLANAIDDQYCEIERLHGERGAQLAAESHTAAIDRIEKIITQENIDCDFERLDGYLFLPPDESIDLLDREMEAAHRAGLSNVERIDRAPLEVFDTGPCLRFPRQGQFHPLKYLAVDLAELAYKHRFHQVWVNDNLGYRNVFVIFTAIASRVPIKVGTAILVPYFRNPIDTADAFAALSELVGGREISVGIARGDYAQAGNQINLIKPISMVKETVHCIKRLLNGETIHYQDYPVLSSFYQLREKSSMRLRFAPKAPILFYSGGNGPKIMRIAGEFMDGVLIGGFFIPLVKSGKLQQLLQAAEVGKAESNRQTSLKKVCEINISVSNDYERARIFPKRYIAHMLLVLDALGFSDAEFEALKIDPEAVKKIKAAFAVGRTIEDVAPMITDAMVDAGFIAGSPRDCIEKLEEMCSCAQAYGFDQICLAKLGPDYGEAITILAQDILPSVLHG